MSEIPEDIRQAAVKAAEIVCRNLDYDDVSLEVGVIAKAILAERQRCASFAETYKLVDHPRLSPGSEINAWWSGQDFAYEAVRRGILNLPPFPTAPKGGEE